MPRKAFKPLDENLRRSFERAGLTVVAPAVADNWRIKLTKHREHVLGTSCWCGPVLIQVETLTTEAIWLHRTKYEAN